MRQHEAEEVLHRITEHTGITFDQKHAAQLAGDVPDWLGPDLAKLAVDEIARHPTLDGAPPPITPFTIIEMAKTLRGGSHADGEPDDAKSYPKSAAGKFAAAYTDVVERVRLNAPELDFRKPSNYFWALQVASGVLKGTNNIRGEEYVGPA